MEDKRETIATRLREAVRAHHQAFIETDGDDPDWPDWYADYLINDLNALLRTKLSLVQLRDLLIELDRVASVKAILPATGHNSMPTDWYDNMAAQLEQSPISDYDLVGHNT